MTDRAERSLEELLADAEAAAAGRLPVAEFVATLDWNIGAIGRAAGPYGPAGAALIGDVIDRAAAGEVEIGPTAIRAIAAAAGTIAREGGQPESVEQVRRQLSASGLLGDGPGRRSAALPVGPAARPTGTAPGSAAPAADPQPRGPAPPPEPASAIDPEMARLTRSLAPRSGVLKPLAVLGLGWAVVLGLVLGVVGGIWLDRGYGTAPFGTLAGVAVGLLLAYLAGRSLVARARSG